MSAAMPSTAAPGWSGGRSAFGTLQGLRYGVLGAPLAFLALPLYITLPSHYSSRHGMSLAVLGAVLMGSRVADAALDPFIGEAVDRVFARSTRSAWLLAGASAAVAAAGFAALFHAPVDGDSLLVWLTVGLLLTYIAYSVLSVIHQAWGARIGGDAAQRSRVVAWREGCGLAGVLLASVLPPLFGMTIASVLLALGLALGIALLSFAPQGASSRRGTPAHWTLPWRVPRFRRLLAVFMLNGIASAVPATLVLFFVRDALELPEWEPVFLGAYFAAAVASVPLWVRAVRRFSLAPVWLAGMGLAVGAFICVLALGRGDAVGFLAVCIGSGLALGADLTIPAALLTGVVQREGHDASAEGVYFGWWTSATKLNLGLAAGAALPLLALAGYTPGQRDAAAQDALAIAYVVVPCALKVAAAVLLFQWHRASRGAE